MSGKTQRARRRVERALADFGDDDLEGHLKKIADLLEDVIFDLSFDDAGWDRYSIRLNSANARAQRARHLLKRGAQ